VEFCGTSITSLANGQARTAERLAENPHFVFADAQRRGYGLLDLGPGGATARLRVLDDATRSDASVHTLARFQVQAGRARVERDG
jgi:alkaline phosphatase D